MKKSNRRIVAKLGKLCIYLNKLESDPEMYGCATVIRKSRILAQQINEDLSATKCNPVTADKVFTVGKYLVDGLICPERYLS